jgi:hypothetical protein
MLIRSVVKELRKKKKKQVCRGSVGREGTPRMAFQLGVC